MKVSELFEGAHYSGKAEGDRKTYYVFETNKCYLVVAPSSPESFNLSVVDREVPEVVARAFKGKRVTARRLREDARRPDLFNVPFAALNALYVMVGLGRARKLKQREGKAMVFKIK